MGVIDWNKHIPLDKTRTFQSPVKGQEVYVNTYPDQTQTPQVKQTPTAVPQATPIGSVIQSGQKTIPANYKVGSGIFTRIIKNTLGKIFRWDDPKVVQLMKEMNDAIGEDKIYVGTNYSKDLGEYKKQSWEMLFKVLKGDISYADYHNWEKENYVGRPVTEYAFKNGLFRGLGIPVQVEIPQELKNTKTQIAETVGDITGSITALMTLNNLLEGAGLTTSAIASKLPKTVLFRYPAVGRWLMNAAKHGVTLSLYDMYREAQEQATNNQFDLGKILEKGVSGALQGSAIAFTGASAKTGVRLATSFLAGLGAGIADTLLEKGKVEKSDLPNIFTNGVVLGLYSLMVPSKLLKEQDVKNLFREAMRVKAEAYFTQNPQFVPEGVDPKTFAEGVANSLFDKIWGETGAKIDFSKMTDAQYDRLMRSLNNYINKTIYDFVTNQKSGSLVINLFPQKPHTDLGLPPETGSSTTGETPPPLGSTPPPTGDIAPSGSTQTPPPPTKEFTLDPKLGVLKTKVSDITPEEAQIIGGGLKKQIFKPSENGIPVYIVKVSDGLYRAYFGQLKPVPDLEANNWGQLQQEVINRMTGKTSQPKTPQSSETAKSTSGTTQQTNTGASQKETADTGTTQQTNTGTSKGRTTKTKQKIDFVVIDEDAGIYKTKRTELTPSEVKKIGVSGSKEIFTDSPNGKKFYTLVSIDKNTYRVYEGNFKKLIGEYNLYLGAFHKIFNLLKGQDVVGDTEKKKENKQSQQETKETAKEQVNEIQYKLRDNGFYESANLPTDEKEKNIGWEWKRYITADVKNDVPFVVVKSITKDAQTGLETTEYLVFKKSPVIDNLVGKVKKYGDVYQVILGQGQEKKQTQEIKKRTQANKTKKKKERQSTKQEETQIQPKGEEQTGEITQKTEEKTTTKKEEAPPKEKVKVAPEEEIKEPPKQTPSVEEEVEAFLGTKKTQPSSGETETGEAKTGETKTGKALTKEEIKNILLNNIASGVPAKTSLEKIPEKKLKFYLKELVNEKKLVKVGKKLLTPEQAEQEKQKAKEKPSKTKEKQKTEPANQEKTGETKKPPEETKKPPEEKPNKGKSLSKQEIKDKIVENAKEGKNLFDGLENIPQKKKDEYIKELLREKKLVNKAGKIVYNGQKEQKPEQEKTQPTGEKHEEKPHKTLEQQVDEFLKGTPSQESTSDTNKGSVSTDKEKTKETTTDLEKEVEQFLGQNKTETEETKETPSEEVKETPSKEQEKEITTDLEKEVESFLGTTETGETKTGETRTETGSVEDEVDEFLGKKEKDSKVQLYIKRYNNAYEGLADVLKGVKEKISRLRHKVDVIKIKNVYRKTTAEKLVSSINFLLDFAQKIVDIMNGDAVLRDETGIKKEVIRQKDFGAKEYALFLQKYAKSALTKTFAIKAYEILKQFSFTIERIIPEQENVPEEKEVLKTDENTDYITTDVEEYKDLANILNRLTKEATNVDTENRQSLLILVDDIVSLINTDQNELALQVLQRSFFTDYSYLRFAPRVINTLFELREQLDQRYKQLGRVKKKGTSKRPLTKIKDQYKVKDVITLAMLDSEENFKAGEHYIAYTPYYAYVIQYKPQQSEAEVTDYFVLKGLIYAKDGATYIAMPEKPIAIGDIFELRHLLLLRTKLVDEGYFKDVNYITDEKTAVPPDKRKTLKDTAKLVGHIWDAKTPEEAQQKVDEVTKKLYDDLVAKGFSPDVVIAILVRPDGLDIIHQIAENGWTEKDLLKHYVFEDGMLIDPEQYYGNMPEEDIDDEYGFENAGSKTYSTHTPEGLKYKVENALYYNGEPMHFGINNSPKARKPYLGIIPPEGILYPDEIQRFILKHRKEIINAMSSFRTKHAQDVKEKARKLESLLETLKGKIPPEDIVKKLAATMEGKTEDVYKELAIFNQISQSMNFWIVNHPMLTSFEKLRAAIAISKLTSGQHIERNELDLLGSVFGQKTVEALSDLSLLDVVISRINDFTMEFKASSDLSVFFQQLKFFVSRYPQYIPKLLDTALKGYKEGILHPEKIPFDILPEDIKELVRSPHIQRMIKQGLSFKIDIYGQLSAIEELKVIGRWLRGSNNAYVAPIQIARIVWADALYRYAEKLGMTTDEDLTYIADFVNTMTGTADLPDKIKEYSKLLSRILWAVKYKMSTFKFLTYGIVLPIQALSGALLKLVKKLNVKNEKLERFLEVVYKRGVKIGWQIGRGGGKIPPTNFSDGVDYEDLPNKRFGLPPYLWGEFFKTLFALTAMTITSVALFYFGAKLILGDKFEVTTDFNILSRNFLAVSIRNRKTGKLLVITPLSGIRSILTLIARLFTKKIKDPDTGLVVPLDVYGTSQIKLLGNWATSMLIPLLQIIARMLGKETKSQAKTFSEKVLEAFAPFVINDTYEASKVLENPDTVTVFAIPFIFGITSFTVNPTNPVSVGQRLTRELKWIKETKFKGKEDEYVKFANKIYDQLLDRYRDLGYNENSDTEEYRGRDYSP